jgi:tetratricopeptide (TPR) repeat protein
LKGDLAEAARFYRRAARAAPEDEEIFAALIDVLRRAGQPDEALRELDHRIATLANSGRALAEKGHLLFGMERFEDAARVLEQALSVTPPEKRFDLQMQLGQSWRRLGQYGKAIDGFAFAARSDNAYSDARAFHASSLIEVADYWQAATVLQAAIDGFSADRTEDRGRRSLGWLWDARGWAIRQTGADMREVTALFRTATEIDPGNSQAKMDLGCALLRDSRTYGEGATTLQALIDAGTAVQGPKQLVGWCYYMLRQYELAEHWLRSLVESNKTDIGMRFDLAVVLLASNAPDAEQEYKSASKMAQQEGRLRQRGLFHVALTDLIDAVDESRIDPSRALQVCQRLWDRLEVAGLRKAELMRLKQAARLQPAD